jgi:hypothetical protein
LLESVKRVTSSYYDEDGLVKLLSRGAKNIHGIASNGGKLQNYHLENLFRNVDEFAEQLKSCAWLLWVNKTLQPFWTSDNPVVPCLMAPKTENVPGFLGNLFNKMRVAGLLLESSNVIELDGTINQEFCLNFPISPNLLLQVCLYNPEEGFQAFRGEMKEELDVHGINFWQLAIP